LAGVRFLLRWLLALALLPALALPTLAAEAITNFTSATTLAVDGSVEVTETIAVEAEGNLIRHGIFRNLFTVLRNDDGSKYYSDLNVLGVERDGRPEPYSVSGITNGRQIRIGDADTYVTDGPHTYVLRYRLSRMARFFADHDELYWNATGNFWDFPILKASATVTLPAGAKISRLAAYTGPLGSTDSDATIHRDADNVATFTANHELRPGDGLTVALAFQKGVVQPASGAAAGGNWLSDHRDSVVPGLAALLVALYHFWAWLRVGRDPKRGTIIPLFHPPQGISPAETQYVHRMGVEGSGWKALTANLFDLGVKGLVTIDNQSEALRVEATGAQPAAPLPADEQLLFDYFGRPGSHAIDKSTGAEINERRGKMLAAIAGASKGTFFNNNLGYVGLGVLLAALCLFAMVWLDVLDAGWLIAAIVTGVIAGVIGGVVRGGLKASSFGSIFFIAIWAIVGGANLLGAIGGAMSSNFILNGPAIGAATIVLITVVFAFLMRAPTLAGRQLMDQIDGFLMYLNTAEKHRLNLTGEPPLTVSRFEAILPFAIALGVEKPWTSKFDAALAAGQVAGTTAGFYRPLWYSGSNFDSNTLTSSMSAISSGMSAAMASAVPQSSSSSGFSGGGGGGGRSGGGGGGGGGGW
jgi:hypothetical protein